MNRVITCEKEKLEGVVVLPASKSISNRALLLSALSGGSMPENLSGSDDSRVLQEALMGTGELVDVGHAGTAMRFLTAYFALKGGVAELTGSERMKRRPLHVLVDALRKLGAGIVYLGEEGYPPLRISPSLLRGGKPFLLDASVSSQFISALMMIAPLIAGGMTINLKGKIVSGSYIRMTAAMMRQFGVEVNLDLDHERISVPEGKYKPINSRIEADWTAASYFYEMLALVGQGRIFIPDLKQESLQGDVQQYILWERLGVRTEWKDGGIYLCASGKTVDFFEVDFTEMPDLALTFIVACCLKNIPFHFHGLETLYMKECDRVAVAVSESRKLGYELHVPRHGELCWNRERNALISLEIDTYQDHRVAMAFAPAGLKFPGLVIHNAGVVTKSFPAFWEQFDRLTCM